MKRWIRTLALAVALALLACAGALADIGDRLRVVNCESYVTLREEPSTSAAALARVPLGARVDWISMASNGFWRVCYNGQTGYVLSQYLKTVDSYRGQAVSPTSKQRYNLNLFLSNFTEQGFMWGGGCYDESNPDPALLTEFAVNHCWFNRQNRLEWGDYFNYNNVRLPKSQIQPIVEKYFGVSITPSKSPRYIDYRDGYYYWEETGGHTNDGFACLSNVEQLDWNRYCVWFDIYGMGENWNNDVCYYNASQASRAYPSSVNYVGRAVINTGTSGLNDRSDWRIERYAVVFDQ